jgi:aerobic C4-dicarboxylate transport protein
MIIAPIIFCTVVSGIAHVADAAKVGRVALKAREMVQGRSSMFFP